MFYEEIRRQAEDAPRDALPAVTKAMWSAFAAGHVTEAEAEALSALIEIRQSRGSQDHRTPPRATQQPQDGVQPLGAALPRRTGSRPRSPESMARRRRWAAAGYLPPRLAQAFTAGEQAVLAVVGKEIAAKGRCTLAVGNIAALAGVSDNTVRRAMRQAALVGLVGIEVRRLTGFRNDTNVITIRSREWVSWLRTRLPRSARSDLGIACQIGQGTNVGALSKAAEARFRPGSRRIAGGLEPAQMAVAGGRRPTSPL